MLGKCYILIFVPLKEPDSRPKSRSETTRPSSASRTKQLLLKHVPYITDPRIATVTSVIAHSVPSDQNAGGSQEYCIRGLCESDDVRQL